MKIYSDSVKTSSSSAPIKKKEKAIKQIKCFPSRLFHRFGVWDWGQSIAQICNLLATVASFHLTNSILLRWAERIGVPAMERERKRERWSNGRLEGKNGCSRPPCSDPPPPSTLSLQSGCYLSIFTLLPSTDRPRPTYVHSPNDTLTHTHIYIQKHTQLQM